MSRRPVLIALVGFVASAAPTATPRGPAVGFTAASVRGTVAVRAATEGPPVTLSPYSRRRYQPPTSPGVAGGVEDAVVYLIDGPADARSPGRAPAPAVVQRNRQIIPYLTIARVGAVVSFPNSDDVFHNLFSLSEGNSFNLGRYSPGLAPEVTFEREGVVRLFCDIHSEMAGVILVIDTELHASPGPDGSFTIPDVPAGSYRAVAWHPVAGADTTRIEVADGDVELRFELRPRR